jgi:radical SAM protein with 4Fe4S-binding SPASM domain
MNKRIPLLRQFLPQTNVLRIRPPDYIEEKEGFYLQVWGAEGYWQVVDREFRDLLKVVEQPASLKTILREHPEWAVHRRDIQVQLRGMEKAGLTGKAPRPSPPPRIENVTINLVTACNLDCHTCYVPQALRSGAKLDVKRLLDFLDELRPCFSSNATLSLLGGEPFLHPDGVVQAGLWAKRHKFACNVSTNGTIISDSLLKGLREAGLKVQVSLDGAVAGTNDAIRGPGTFQKAIGTIQRLVECGIPTTLCMVCCQENIREIPAYFRLAQKLGAGEVRFIPLKKLGNSKAGLVAPAPQYEIVKAICTELDADPGLRPMCRSDIYSIVRSMLRESSRRQTCGSGTQTLLVQADGTIYPCINTTIPDLKLGHIAGGRAPALAKGADFGRLLSVDSSAHPCYGCHVKRWCLAGCPGETLQQAGALNRPHWNCEDLKQTITYVMWRLAHEQQSSEEKVARSLI